MPDLVGPDGHEPLPDPGYYCRVACKRAIFILSFLLGFCLLPFALVVDIVCDTMTYIVQPRRAVIIDDWRCWIAVMAVGATWCCVIVSLFRLQGPLVAGVCVCGHSMWY